MEDQIVPEGLHEWQQIDDESSSAINLEAFDSLSSLSGLEMSSGDEAEEATAEAEEDEAKVEEIEAERRLSRRLGAVGSEIIQAACNVKNHVVSSISGLKTKNGIAILMSSAASGSVVLVLASLFYMKMQSRQRKAQLETTEKFMILIKEKDQKMNKLLSQIYHMNELLQARRKVQVIRVG